MKTMKFSKKGFNGGNMDYKKLIIELLEKADDRKLKLIYCYVKAILGKDKGETNE